MNCFRFFFLLKSAYPCGINSMKYGELMVYGNSSMWLAASQGLRYLSSSIYKTDFAQHFKAHFNMFLYSGWQPSQNPTLLLIQIILHKCCSMYSDLDRSFNRQLFWELVFLARSHRPRWIFLLSHVCPGQARSCYKNIVQHFKSNGFLKKKTLCK